MTLTHIFACNVKEQRQSKGMTQASLAQKADLHVTYINAIENERRNISLTNLERIAKALDIEPYVLLLPKEDD